MIKAFLVLCWIFSALLFIELVLRLLHRLNYGSPLPYGLRSEEFGRLGCVKLAPRFSAKGRSGVLYSTNSRGYRDDEIDLSKRHILFLGDSTTFGMNINHEDTYPQKCERMLNQTHGNFQSVNTATPGQGTCEQLDILKSEFTRKELNIRAAVMGFFMNDFSDNYSYLRWHSEISRKGAFLRLKSFIKKKIGLPRLYLYMAYLRAKAMKGKKDSATDPGYAIAFDLLTEEEIYKNKSWALTIETIDKIAELCEAYRVVFVFMYLPSGEVEIKSGKSPLYKRLLERHLNMRNIVYIDVLEIYGKYLKDSYGEGKLPQGFYSSGNDARHPGPLACELIGRELFYVLKEKMIAENSCAPKLM